MAISPKGTYVGSGQINHIGFKASAKLWDFKKKSLIGTHELHKVSTYLTIPNIYNLFIRSVLFLASAC